VPADKATLLGSVYSFQRIASYLTAVEMHIVTQTMITIIAPSPDDKRIYLTASIATGEMCRATDVIVHASGKGVNAARALACIGIRSRLVSPVGKDFHPRLQTDLETHGIVLHCIETVAPTRVCVTLLEDNGRATEIVQEASPLSKAEANEFFQACLEAVDEADALLLAGSLPPGCDARLYSVCTDRAAQRDIPVLVDAHGDALLSSLRARPSAVKINREEVVETASLLGKHLSLEDSIAAMRSSGARDIIVSNSSEAVHVFRPDGTRWSVQPPTIHLQNAVGSGDAMSAGVLYGLYSGESLYDAVCRGVRMGSANAMTLLPGELDTNALHTFPDPAVR